MYFFIDTNIYYCVILINKLNKELNNMNNFNNQIKTKTNYSIEGLIKKAIEEFKNLSNEIDNSNLERYLHEISDSYTPIYYWDIAQFLAHNNILGFPDEITGDSIFPVIQSQLYNRIYEGLSNWYYNEYSKGVK